MNAEEKVKILLKSKMQSNSVERKKKTKDNARKKNRRAC